MMFSRYASRLFRVRNYLENNAIVLTNKFKRISEPIVRKCEGTVIGRAGTFLKNVAIDYREVFVETYNNTKANPTRMAIYLGVFGAGASCVALNPDEASFRDVLLTNEQRVILLSESSRNPLPVTKMTLIETYCNEGRMRWINLGLLSVMWIHDYDEGTALFDAQCEYLKPTLDSYPSRIIDIGFLGRWWLLSRYMIDYDINPEEFK